MLLDAIRARCKAQGITIAELEERAGLRKGVIWRWNEMNPNLDNALAVARVLNVSVEDLAKEGGGKKIE